MLTVVIPTHNRPELCVRAVKSVAAVDVPTEIIVVDDVPSALGSSQTEQLLKALKLPNLYYSQMQPSTAEQAINEGFTRGSWPPSPFITWLPDDDEWTPEFGKLLKWITRCGADIGVVYGDCQIEPEQTLVPGEKKSGRIFQDLLRDNFIPGQAVIFRRKLLGYGLSTHPLTEGLSDYELWLRLSRRTHFLHVPEVVAITHKTPGQKSEWSLEEWGIAHINLMHFMLKTYTLTDEERTAVKKRLEWAISHTYWNRHKWIGKIGRTYENWLSSNQ